MIVEQLNFKGERVRRAFSLLEAKLRVTQSELLGDPLGGENDQERLSKLKDRFIILLSRLSDDFHSVWSSLHPRSGNEHFYFWPGFQSRLFGRLRLTPPQEVRNTLGRLGYSGYETLGVGRGYPSDDDKIDRTAVYFDAILNPDSSVKNRLGVTGGTHNWLTEVPKPEVLGGEPSQRTELEVLEIGVGSEQRAEIIDQGWLRVILDKSKAPDWGRSVSSILNSSSYIRRDNHLPWPLPYRFSGESDQEFMTRIRTLMGQAEEDREESTRIREDLYSIWLGACFLPPDELCQLLEGPFTVQLRARLRSVAPSIEERLAWFAEVESTAVTKNCFEPRHYTWWTNLALAEPLAVTFNRSITAADRELGSAMFLSSGPLDPAFVLSARHWVFSYYLTLRHLENAFAFGRQKAAEAAVRQQKLLRAQQAHAIGTEFVFIASRSKSIRNNLDNFSVHVRESVVSSWLRARLKRPDFFKAEWDKACQGYVTDLTTLNNLEKKFIEAVLNQQAKDFSSDQSRVPVDFALSLFNLLDTSYFARAMRASWALENETRKATLQNLALLRIDEGDLKVATASPVAAPQRFDTLLSRSLLVALTTYFDRSLPSGAERGEVTYISSFKTLVAKNGPSLVLSWHEFLDQTRTDDNLLADIIAWINFELPRYSALRIRVSLPSDREAGISVVSGARTDTALALLQACLQEMLLNALKYVRPSTNGGEAEVDVSVGMTPFELMSVENTVGTSFTERALAVGLEGHFGVGFLRYAAEKLLGQDCFFAGRVSDRNVLVRFGKTEERD
jgi:hypothetical protein